jgi:hypothetical protein
LTALAPGPRRIATNSEATFVTWRFERSLIGSARREDRRPLGTISLAQTRRG